MTSSDKTTDGRSRKRSRKTLSADESESAPREDTSGPPQSPVHHGIFMFLREWIDPLIFAYILAMFIRTFVVELFKIPSGSMTPTLVGDMVAEFDYVNPQAGFEEDGLNELVVGDRVMDSGAGELRGRFQIFKMGPDGYRRDIPTYITSYLSPPAARKFRENQELRYDRICVNKFAFWFKEAHRGDIVVFKVPRSEFQPAKPIYVKRVAGLPGEHIEIRSETGREEDFRLWADGAPVTTPAFFRDHYYERKFFSGRVLSDVEPEYLMFGDNTQNSTDSRYFGPVPGDNFRGKVFLRYMPFKNFRLF